MPAHATSLMTSGLSVARSVSVFELVEVFPAASMATTESVVVASKETVRVVVVAEVVGSVRPFCVTTNDDARVGESHDIEIVLVGMRQKEVVIDDAQSVMVRVGAVGGVRNTETSKVRAKEMFPAASVAVTVVE